jgi:hypothetical protein
MTDEKQADGEAVLSSAGLGLDPKRAQFEKTMRQWCPEHWTFEEDGCGGYHNVATELAWIAWQGATGTERARCAELCAAKFNELDARNTGHHNEYQNGALDAWDMAERLILEA